MTKEKADKVFTVTLTDERPVNVKNGNWPVLASASHDKDHNNQEIFRRHYLRVRIHDTGENPEYYTPHPDGRCLVYGWYSSSYQGEAGAQAGYRCHIDDAVETVRKVGERIGAPQWLIDDCVADLPAVEESENESPLEALCAKWISDEQALREKITEARVSGKANESSTLRADQLAECRRALQEAAHLVTIPQ